MIDPFSLFSAVATGLQAFINAKSYFLHRQEEKEKRQQREQEEEEEEEEEQQQAAQENNVATDYSGTSVTHTGNFVLPWSFHRPAAFGYEPHFGVFRAGLRYPGSPAQDVLIGFPYGPPAAQTWQLSPHPAKINPHSYRFHPRQRASPSHHGCPAAAFEIGGRVDALAPFSETPHPHEFAGGKGLCTGRDPSSSNHVQLARRHWSFFQQNSPPQGLTPTVAVAHWESGQMDVFVEAEGVYYLNYQVRACNVMGFAAKYKEKEVFSGQLAGRTLVRCNKEIRFREPRGFELATNSWLLLGLVEESLPRAAYEQDPVLVEMAGGALFGLLCALYISPWQLNVTIKSAPCSSGKLAAIVSTSPSLQGWSRRRHTCFFSVFAFNAHPWTYNSLVIG